MLIANLVLTLFLLLFRVRGRLLLKAIVVPHAAKSLLRSELIRDGRKYQVVAVVEAELLRLLNRLEPLRSLVQIVHVQVLCREPLELIVLVNHVVIDVHHRRIKDFKRTDGKQHTVRLVVSEVVFAQRLRIWL